MTTEHLTPDAVRTLIAELERFAAAEKHQGAWLTADRYARAAAALTAALPREDLVLDKVEALIREASDPYSWDDHSRIWLIGDLRDGLSALLARVRTAEAERDEYREAYEGWRTRGQQMDRSLLAIWHAAEPGDTKHMTFGEDPAAVEESVYAAFRASRTVETAEEWGLTYSRNVRNARPSSTAAQYGRTEREHHQDCAGDTGTSHKLPGRLYIVQCEWCPRAFAAPTKREAMSMFRDHEDAMNEPVPPTTEEVDR